MVSGIIKSQPLNAFEYHHLMVIYWKGRTLRDVLRLGLQVTRAHSCLVGSLFY